MAEMKDKCVPKLRFPEFKNDGEWAIKRLGEIAIVVDEKCNIGKLDIKTYISTENMLQNFEGIKKASKLPDTGSFTRFQKGDILFSNIRPYLKKVWQAEFEGAASNDVIVFRAQTNYDSDFVCQIIKSDSFIAHTMVGAKGVKMPRGDKNMILDYPLCVPALAEQRRIAACLSALDEMHFAANSKLEQLKVYKIGLMQNLFPAPGKALPDYRFPEFKNDKEWTTSILGAVTKVVNRRNKGNRVLPVYSISNKRGFILQSEQFDGVDSNDRGYDISAYKIVTSNLFAYNPARINVGSWGYSDSIKEGLISSLYVCFKCTDELADDFLKCFLDSYSFQRAVDNNVEGGIRSYLFYENFARIKIPIPSMLEQKKVASCIISANSLIELYSERVEVLLSYKKALMQRLFP